MPLNRRDWLVETGQLLAVSSLKPSVLAIATDADQAAQQTRSLASVRDDFPMARTRVYLNNASVHPMSLSAMRAVTHYLDHRVHGLRPGQHFSSAADLSKRAFASLINAQLPEVSFVTSTEVGENLVLSGMGLAAAGNAGRSGGGSNIVTDALHFEGSLYMYRSLQAQGLDVRIVMPRDGRIDLADLEARIDGNTRLVAVSLVSFLNGFQHDLKGVCDLAHARGAHVYADIIQAAGAVPVDVRATGVDFCACATYKWLMGDFGIGFFFVREDLLGSVIKRTQYGFEQFTDLSYHLFPHQPPADAPVTWTPASGAPAYFEVGTADYAAMSALAYSLGLIQHLGVSNIQVHHQSLTRRLQRELPHLGYQRLTPVDNPSPIVAFSVADEEATTRRLAKANVEVKVDQHIMRISPSLYNNDRDIDALLTALS